MVKLVGGGSLSNEATPSSFSQTAKKFIKDNFVFIISGYIFIHLLVSMLKAYVPSLNYSKVPFVIVLEFCHQNLIQG